MAWYDEGVTRVKTAVRENPLQFTPFAWREAAVPMAKGLGTGLGVPQAGEDLGYAMRGALNVTPFGGLKTSAITGIPKSYEPTTPRQRAIQDISQGIYGSALMSPILGARAAGPLARTMTGSQITRLGLGQVARTIPSVATMGAGLGAGIRAIGNVLTDQPISSGLPQAVGQGAQFALKTMPTMLGTQALVGKVAESVPALRQLTEQGIKGYAPIAEQTIGQYAKSIGDVGIRRLIRGVLLETPIEAITYGVVNKRGEEGLMRSIEREAYENLIYNIGFAGFNTASSAMSPLVRGAVKNAIETFRGGVVAEPQAGFVGTPEAMFKALTKSQVDRLPKFVPVAEGPGAKTRVMVSDADSRLAIPTTALKKAQSGVDMVLPLKNILQHDILYKAYPEMADIPVAIIPQRGQMRVPGAVGLFDPEQGRIELLVDPTAGDIRKNVLHEIQHVIQDVEGFPGGGSPARSMDEQTAQIMDDYAMAANLRRMYEMGGKKSWDSIVKGVGGATKRAVQYAMDQPLQELDRAVRTLKTLSEMEGWQGYQGTVGEQEARGTELLASLSQRKLAGIDPYDTARRYAQMEATGTVTPLPKELQANVSKPDTYSVEGTQRDIEVDQKLLAQYEKDIADPNTNQANLDYLKRSRDLLQKDLQRLWKLRNQNWNPLQEATLVYDENNVPHYVDANTGEVLNPRVENIPTDRNAPLPVVLSKLHYNEAVDKYNKALGDYVAGGGMQASTHNRTPTAEIRKLYANIDSAKQMMEAVASGDIQTITTLNNKIPRNMRFSKAMLNQGVQANIPKMTRQQYINQFGEDPVDMFGRDWQKVVNASLPVKQGAEWARSAEKAVYDQPQVPVYGGPGGFGQEMPMDVEANVPKAGEPNYIRGWDSTGKNITFVPGQDTVFEMPKEWGNQVVVSKTFTKSPQTGNIDVNIRTNDGEILIMPAESLTYKGKLESLPQANVPKIPVDQQLATWIKTELVNNEVSSDAELRQAFANQGVSERGLDMLMTLRNQILGAGGMINSQEFVNDSVDDILRMSSDVQANVPKAVRVKELGDLQAELKAWNAKLARPGLSEAETSEAFNKVGDLETEISVLKGRGVQANIPGPTDPYLAYSKNTGLNMANNPPPTKEDYQDIIKSFKQEARHIPNSWSGVLDLGNKQENYQQSIKELTDEMNSLFPKGGPLPKVRPR
jgi:hypothetical protein